MDNIEDSIPLGMQQLIDTESNGKIWLNSIPVVNELLDDLQRVAWHARIQQAKHEITAHKSAYLVNAKISELVQIFEGRNPAYAVLPWNTDPHQMKAYIMKQDDYWGDDADVIYDDALPRLLNLKWFTEFGHLNRGDMLTSEHYRCLNEKKKFQCRV